MAQAATTLNQAVKTSVGRKVLVGLTGIGLMVFVISHLTGNLLMLKNDGGAAFDGYAHFMKTTPIIWVAEIGLFGVILAHIVLALAVSLKNRAARPVQYAVRKEQATSFFSRYMVHTGIIFLVFLIVHLWSFFFSHKVMSWLTGAPMAGLPESLYETAKHKFQNPLFSLFYVIAMVTLAFHLTHGFWSAFQTLGWCINKTIERNLKAGAVVFAIVISAGFAIIPLYFLFTA